jgi:hypothetical protein
VLQGYWYALSGGENEHCRVHEWDARTNPHMPDVRAYFIKVLNRMGGIPPREEWPEGVESLDDILRDPKHWHLLPATFVREYLGKWVTDLKALIYRITPRNTFRDLPIAPDRCTIGVDLGGHNSEDPGLDHAAITVACSNATLPFIWVLESFRLSDITTDTLVAKLSQLMQHYPEATIYIDSSSAGKIIENTFKKYSLPIRGALKGPKLRRIQLLQSAIANGNLQLHILKTMDLREESQLLVWDEVKADHAKRCADDCWDSAHYACIPHFGDYQPEQNEVEKGSKEWERQQEMAEYEEALSEAMDEVGIEDLSA